MNTHQLTWMLKRIEIMSTSLGGSGAENIDIPKDTFENARKEFENSIKEY